MRKSEPLTNILYLLNLYVRDSLKGILRHPFFKKRRHIWLLLGLAISSYLFYFYLNAVEIAQLSHFNQHYSFDELRTVISLSIVSYNHLSMIAGVFVFLLVNMTLHLHPTSLFLSKVLPYTEREVYLSVKLFKIGLALLFFELFFILLMPGLGILRSLWVSLSLLLSCHLSFLATYLLANMLYTVSLMVLPFSTRVVQWLISILYGVLALSYLLVGRFTVEFYLVSFNSDPKLLSLLLMLVSLVVFISLLILDKSQYDLVFLKAHFVRVFSIPFLGRRFRWFPLVIIRTKFFLYNLIVILFLGSYSLMIGGVAMAIQNLLDFWPLLASSFVLYADATLQQRKMYYHLRIGTVTEIAYLLLTFLMIHFPLLYLAYIKGDYIVFGYALSIALVSLIIGFLFPRSTGSTNETVSFILLVLAVLMLYFLIKVPLLLFIFIPILLLLLAYVIKNETEHF